MDVRRSLLCLISLIAFLIATFVCWKIFWVIVGTSESRRDGQSLGSKITGGWKYTSNDGKARIWLKEANIGQNSKMGWSLTFSPWNGIRKLFGALKRFNKKQVEKKVEVLGGKDEEKMEPKEGVGDEEGRDSKAKEELGNKIMTFMKVMTKRAKEPNGKLEYKHVGLNQVKYSVPEDNSTRKTNHSDESIAINKRPTE